jgi:predicted Zn finger-like uncharacterized protein
MGCCGKSTPKTIQRTAVKKVTKKVEQNLAQSIYPKSTQNIVSKSKSTVQKAQLRAAGVKNCPMCGTLITVVLAGSGVRRRKICKKCGKQFAA